MSLFTYTPDIQQAALPRLHMDVQEASQPQHHQTWTPTPPLKPAPAEAFLSSVDGGIIFPAAQDKNLRLLGITFSHTLNLVNQ